MTRAWMVAWCLSVVGCAESVGTSEPTATDASADVAGDVAGDAVTGLDSPAAADVTAPRDVATRRDVNRARDAGVPPDRPAPTGPFVLQSSGSSGCGGWFEPNPWGHSVHTFYGDGGVWRIGGQSLWQYDDLGMLPGGAEDVARLRRDIEATGLLDVPEGTYYRASDTCAQRALEYRRGDRLLTWTITYEGDGPAPPRPIDAAFEVIAAALGTIP